MKKVLISICILFIGTIVIYALVDEFSVNSSKLSFLTNNKENSVLNNFKDDYNLSYSIKSKDEELNKEITELAKKTTYLLLGDFNNVNESSENYYKRHKEYLNLRYAPEIPKDESTFSGLDENSQEYLDDLVSGMSVPQLFNKFNEMNVIYKDFGEISISKANDIVIASVLLKDVKLKEQNKDDPMKYDIIQTNLVIYYYYKKLNDEYKLYYLYGQTDVDLSDYLLVLEDSEDDQTMQMAPSYESKLEDIYNFSKLEKMSDSEFNNIYDINAKNIVVLNSYYNNYLIASANGFFINKGLIVTTWNFLEKSLIEAQYIAIKDNNGNSYSIEGIVTVNPESDVVVIKMKEEISNQVSLGDSKNLKLEDPLITISSKTGTGLTLQKGIVITNDGYIQSSIPLTYSDEGSPLFNKEGKVVGMNTAKRVNTDISIAVSSEALKEVQEKFSDIDFNSIETITFNELKEKFYYVNYNDEIIKNNIPSSKWKIYSSIGNVEENIKLSLVKANYTDGIVSLRYKNEISNYISSMQLASSFREELINEGYDETLKGIKKCIYENKEYQVIIMDEFNHLIVVMVKK